jgi:hypothetical protein
MGGVSAAIDLAARLGHVPLERNGLPAVTILPRPKGSLLRDLTGFGEADSSVAELLQARLGAAGVTSAIRLLAPFLLGDGTGIEARMPYDLEIR